MRPAPMDFFGDMDDHGFTMAMDVDDVDTLESFADGVIGENKLADLTSSTHSRTISTTPTSIEPTATSSPSNPCKHRGM